MNRSARTQRPSHPLPRVTLERDSAAVAGTAQQLPGSFVTSHRPAEVWKEINGPRNQDKVVSGLNRTEDDSARRLAALMWLIRRGRGSLESAASAQRKVFWVFKRAAAPERKDSIKEMTGRDQAFLSCVLPSPAVHPG